MKNISKVLSVVAMLLASSALLQAIAVTTSDNRTMQVGADVVAHMKVIQKEIRMGRGSNANPVMLNDVTSDEFKSAVACAGNNDRFLAQSSREVLQRAFSAARKLEDEDLMRRLERALER
jgi:hypothetical protein